MHDQPLTDPIRSTEQMLPCDFCSDTARYEFITTPGQWAFGCVEHYKSERLHEALGQGKGQQLIYTDTE